MPITDSPLRYPGGKSQLAPFVIDVMKMNDLFYGHYAEPFAGGAGIAWRLLLNNYVTHVHLNDIDPAIYAFWHCVLYKTDEFCERIEKCRVTVTEWRAQKAIQKLRRPRLLDLGFSTLFLNRTSRSGILDGGIIGGLDQKGEYKVDCRFNKPEIIRKIQRIGGQRGRVSLHKLDAIEFLRTQLKSVPKQALVNIDPPYYNKGRELYSNHYKPDDHAALAREVARIKQRWMVTYDNTPATRKLYAGYPQFGNELYYSAEVKRLGVELLVLDPKLMAPGLRTTNGRPLVRHRRVCASLSTLANK